MPSRKVYHVVVLGAGGVGKSCLTAQFVQRIWIESYDPTIEDSYRKVVDVDGESIVLEILDTAGTEQFTSMREIYMKSGQGFLLVYSITNMQSIGDLPTIHDQICRIKESDKVPIVLVGNKSDLEADRAVSKNRAKFLSRKWGSAALYETSAKKRTNVDEVFLDLCRQMLKQSKADNKDQPTRRSRREERAAASGGGSGSIKGQGRKHFCVIL